MRVATILVGGALIASSVAATHYFDAPLSPEELAHQRVHEHKQRDMQTAKAAHARLGILPDGRVSDVPCVDGKALNFECQGIDLLSFVPWQELDTTDARAVTDKELTDIWGWTDPETGDEYIIFGETSGVGFMRITDPYNPVYLGELNSKAVAQLHWHDIKVHDDHAFIVSEAAPHGMTVFDLTKLRDAEGAQTWVEDAFYPLPVSAHNIAINEDSGFAYIVGGNAGLVVPDQCASGLHMVDISDPKLPVFAGCYIGDEGPGTGPGLTGPTAENSPLSYIHDTQCVIYEGPDTEHNGKELCFNSSEDKFSIVNVTDKANPVRIGVLEYENTAYTHQGWLTEDRAYFLLGDELDEQDFEINTRTLLFDVTDLDEPKHAGDGEHLHGTNSIDHNMYTRDGLVYQSNYTSGLRVLDTDRIAAGELELIAWFDTYPLPSPTPIFAGTWSNYPYFESGTIAVTSGVEGVFLLKVQDAVLDAHAGPRDPTN